MFLVILVIANYFSVPWPINCPFTVELFEIKLLEFFKSLNPRDTNISGDNAINY